MRAKVGLATAVSLAIATPRCPAPLQGPRSPSLTGLDAEGVAEVSQDLIAVVASRKATGKHGVGLNRGLTICLLGGESQIGGYGVLISS